MSQCTFGVAVREVELGAGGTDREVQQEEALCAAEATRLKLNAANNAEQTKSESLRRCNR
jgi:hypothetical protein